MPALLQVLGERETPCPEIQTGAPASFVGEDEVHSRDSEEQPGPKLLLERRFVCLAVEIQRHLLEKEGLGALWRAPESGLPAR